MSVLMQAEQLLQDLSGWRIFDCRSTLTDPDAGRQMYLAGHLPGALFADLERDLAAPAAIPGGRHPLPERADFIAWLGQQGLSGTEPVVVYDALGGAFAARLWWMLLWVGHRGPVTVLNGGIEAWLQAGGELVTQPTSPAALTYVAAEARVHTCDFEYVDQAQRAGQLCAIDARAGARYRGEFEPFGARAGHIPGAWSLPFEQHLEAGYVRPLAQVDACLARLPSQTPVLYCGSGVTACFNALMFAATKRPIPPLYVGSWSEWQQRSDDIATGWPDDHPELSG